MRGGRLQEVSNVGIWQKNFWYFGKLVAYKRWSQPEVQLYFDQAPTVHVPCMKCQIALS